MKFKIEKNDRHSFRSRIFLNEEERNKGDLMTPKPQNPVIINFKMRAIIDKIHLIFKIKMNY